MKGSYISQSFFALSNCLEQRNGLCTMAPVQCSGPFAEKMNEQANCFHSTDM